MGSHLREQHRPKRKLPSPRLRCQISEVAAGRIDVARPLVNAGDGDRRAGLSEGFAGFLVGRRADAQHLPNSHGGRHHFPPATDRAAGPVSSYSGQARRTIDKGNTSGSSFRFVICLSRTCRPASFRSKVQVHCRIRYLNSVCGIQMRCHCRRFFWFLLEFPTF